MPGATTMANPCGFKPVSKKIKVWVDPDWSPGGIPWDLERSGMAKVYARRAMKTWVSAWLVIDNTPQKTSTARTRKKTVDK